MKWSQDSGSDLFGNYNNENKNGRIIDMRNEHQNGEKPDDNGIIAGTDAGRFLVTVVCSIVLFVLAFHFLFPTMETFESGGTAVYDWLQQLSTKLAFHIFVAVLAGVLVGWRCSQYVRLRGDFEKAKTNRGLLLVEIRRSV